MNFETRRTNFYGLVHRWRHIKNLFFKVLGEFWGFCFLSLLFLLTKRKMTWCNRIFGLFLNWQSRIPGWLLYTSKGFRAWRTTHAAEAPMYLFHPFLSSLSKRYRLQCLESPGSLSLPPVCVCVLDIYNLLSVVYPVNLYWHTRSGGETLLVHSSRQQRLRYKVTAVERDAVVSGWRHGPGNRSGRRLIQQKSSVAA